MIYFVRHGETDHNLYKIYVGQKDVPLNKVGFEQASRTAKELQNIHFDACYCSPLIRARQTCDEIIKYHPYLTPIIDDRIIERTYGKIENMPVFTIKFNRWQIGLNDQIMSKLGIELPIDFYGRIASFYDHIYAKHGDGNVLVVAHSGVGKISTAYFYGFPPNNDFAKLSIPNAGVVKFNKKVAHFVNDLKL